MCISSDPVFKGAIWKGDCDADTYPTPVYIAHFEEKKHFYPVRSIGQFYGYSYYCVYCKKGYNTLANHRFKCPVTCPKCLKPTKKQCLENGIFQFLQNFFFLDEDGFKMECKKINEIGCGKIFFNKNCYDAHLKTMCAKEIWCPNCKKYDVNDGGHECDKLLCPFCKIRHPFGRRHCYVTPIVPKQVKPYRMVAFDSESILQGPRSVIMDDYIQR